MKPALSIIVTSYNIPQYILQALSSVVDQGLENVEIILVDDGSKDRTLLRAAGFLKDKANVRIIAQANAGPGAARNVGVLHATADYVAYLDGDDWFVPGALSLLYNTMLEHPADIILSNRQRYYERTNVFGTAEPAFTKKAHGPVAKVPEVMRIIAIHGKLYRRKFLLDNQIVFPVGMSSEDFVFTYTTYALAESVSVVPELTYIWRRRDGGGSLTTERLSQYNLLGRFKQIEMTQNIVKTTPLRERYPRTNFARIDFELRLMRHVRALPREKNIQTRDWALGEIRGFIARHQEAIFSSVSDKTKKMYEAILASDIDMIKKLCDEERTA